MAWDILQPTNTTKIRNLGVVIRPNWAAIQQADSTFLPNAINFKNRTPSVVPINPAAIATSYITFCKEDGAGNPELFGISPSSQIIQFTKAGRLGVSTQGVNALNFSMDSTAFTYGINQMIVATGSFNSSGTLTSGVNMSTGTNPSTGIYTVRVNADVLLNNNYKVIVTSLTTNNERVLNVTSKGAVVAGNPTIIGLQMVSGSGSSRSDPFEVIVVGGR